MDMKQMMRQAQKMQKQLNEAQEEIAQMTYEASAGGGMVKAEVGGDMTLRSIEIDPDAVDPEDVEMLQDLILAAVNGAIKVADDETNKAMSKLQGGLGGLGGFPGLF